MQAVTPEALVLPSCLYYTQGTSSSSQVLLCKRHEPHKLLRHLYVSITAIGLQTVQSFPVLLTAPHAVAVRASQGCYVGQT